ncbi:hypothetical protein H8A95_05195 [Bradyrhizobium sp. Pear76]|uniref:hypothetical protein n=1 Tax=Bradyrhizobium oropedii TaxID=1571201 RepID=UPI001E56EE10|nr:hypothetical protein [Bradyrhizobium oropedii]MCC8961731.1 hypothetical protein [Bradyrhizobium oropedii]
MDSYSLGGLVEVTGAKRRSLQLWADRGVIQADRGTEDAGTGTHRQFSREEAIIGCAIRPFAERQIAIGELKKIATALRSMMLLDANAKVFSSAIGGDGDTMLICESWDAKEDREYRCSIAQTAVDPRGSQKIYFLHHHKPNSMVMAIRLETYLGKLK